MAAHPEVLRRVQPGARGPSGSRERALLVHQSPPGSPSRYLAGADFDFSPRMDAECIDLLPQSPIEPHSSREEFLLFPPPWIVGVGSLWGVGKKLREFATSSVRHRPAAPKRQHRTL